jgi:hypothetical protein
LDELSADELSADELSADELSAGDAVVPFFSLTGLKSEHQDLFYFYLFSQSTLYHSIQSSF